MFLIGLARRLPFPPTSIYRLCRSKMIYGLILVIAIPACVLGIITGVRALIIQV